MQPHPLTPSPNSERGNLLAHLIIGSPLQQNSRLRGKSGAAFKGCPDLHSTDCTLRLARDWHAAQSTGHDTYIGRVNPACNTCILHLIPLTVGGTPNHIDYRTPFQIGKDRVASSGAST